MAATDSSAADLWLGHFTEVEPVWSNAWRGLYSARTADGEPRLVLVAPPTMDRDAARTWLDRVADIYGRFDADGLPSTDLRGRVGEIEFVSFHCDAVTDMGYIAGLQGYKLPYTAWYSMALECHGALNALHRTIDPATGRGHMLGRWSLCNVMLGRSGKLWLFNYGVGASAAVTSSGTDAVVALSVAAGAPARVHDDLQAIVDAMFKLIVRLRDIPPRLAKLLGGQADGESAAVMNAFTQGMARIRGVGKPFESADELMELHATVIGALDLEVPSDSLSSVMAEVAALHRDGTQTVGPPVLDRDAEPPRLWSFERFELLNKLGSGGMGTAYLARDREQQRDVVLKVLRDRSFEAKKRFQREVRLIRQLSGHRHIVRGEELVEEDGLLAAVMEHIDGPPLSVWLKQHADAPDYLARLLGLATEVADALVEVHAAGVTHRDVKPSNILVHPERGAVLVDFGVANMDDTTRLTKTGIAVGTLRYMAPEQTRGHVTPAIDVYALGRVLSEAVEGRDVPVDLTVLLQEALQQAPGHRPTAAEFRDRLSAVV